VKRTVFWLSPCYEFTTAHRSEKTTARSDQAWRTCAYDLVPLLGRTIPAAKLSVAGLTTDNVNILDLYSSPPPAFHERGHVNDWVWPDGLPTNTCWLMGSQHG
jgi:hypothetical protein